MYFLLGLPVNKAYKRVCELNRLSYEGLMQHKLALLKELYSARPLSKPLDTESQISALLQSLDIKDKSSFQKLELTEKQTKAAFSRETAGTTGTPLKLYYTKNTIAHQLAVRRYCFSSYGVMLGEREARFWGRREETFKSKLKEKVLNRKVFSFLGEPHYEIDSLRKFKPSYAYGYSSLILNAAKAYDSLRIKPPKLKVIICTAETLMDFQIEFITKVFQCPVVMEYGCTEFDVIAFQCHEGEYHQVNPDLLLEESSKGCLVTDFNNTLMKMHRYRLGDDLTLSVPLCSCESHLPVITEIKGRSNKQLVKLPCGKQVHAVVFAYIAEELNEQGYQISNFKVIQKKINSFEFFVEVSNDERAESAPKIIVKIKELFSEKLGDDLLLNIYFKEVPLELGKKFDYFECLVPVSD